MTPAEFAQSPAVDDTGPEQPVDDLAAFLATLTEVLRETISKLEQTASKVTDHIVTMPAQTDRALVVALQDFDRLNQEFAAICDALARTGTSMTGSWTREEGGDHPKYKVIKAISVADLRNRVLDRLNSASEPSVNLLLERPLPRANDGTIAEF